MRLPPPASAPVGETTPRNKNLPIFIGLGVLAVICVCVALGFYIDSNYLWCSVSLNMIPGCP